MAVVRGHAQQGGYAVVNRPHQDDTVVFATALDVV